LIKSFSDLEVYKKAFAISIEIHSASLKFPKTEQYALSDQIRRASKSICANLAEGFYRQRASNADYMRFIIIALGSSGEMLVWVDYCEKLSYINPETSQRWKEAYEEISKMLHGLYTSRSKIKP
jgi:four helix bundle protein